MEKKTQQRMAVIDALSNGDAQYAAMLRNMRLLEKAYNNVLHALSEQQRDVVCDFVSLCEEMSWRKLELACTHMIFPK